MEVTDLGRLAGREAASTLNILDTKTMRGAESSALHARKSVRTMQSLNHWLAVWTMLPLNRKFEQHGPCHTLNHHYAQYGPCHH